MLTRTLSATFPWPGHPQAIEISNLVRTPVRPDALARVGWAPQIADLGHSAFLLVAPESEELDDLDAPSCCFGNGSQFADMWGIENRDAGMGTKFSNLFTHRLPERKPGYLWFDRPVGPLVPGALLYLAMTESRALPLPQEADIEDVVRLMSEQYLLPNTRDPASPLSLIPFPVRLVHDPLGFLRERKAKFFEQAPL